MNPSFAPVHPQRASLQQEIHARPPEPMGVPLAISHVVMTCDALQREASRAHVERLLVDSGAQPPDRQAIHVRADVGPFRLRWELHTEFVSWTFSKAMTAREAESVEPATALRSVPAAWLSALPGECLAAMHLWVVPPTAAARDLVGQMLDDSRLVGSTALGGRASIYSDFSVYPDGFARTIVLADDSSPRQLGRLVQQLLEIDTYRMAALLGLPAARGAAAVLGSAEVELADLAEAIRVARRDEEPLLLDRLTRLAGLVEGHYAATHSRFSASAAYFELIDRRVTDIGEIRLANLPTIGEFVNRRLSPARATCAWARRRQEALSQRVSRVSNLLRTRVEIEQQQSSKELLEALNRRQLLQLRLQTTVEGLSVAAITYYIVGLISYLAKGAHGLGWQVSAEGATAITIPFVLIGVWRFVRRLHRRVLID